MGISSGDLGTLNFLRLKVDPIISFVETRGTQGGRGGPGGKPGKGYPGLLGGPLAFPWVLLALQNKNGIYL